MPRKLTYWKEYYEKNKEREKIRKRAWYLKNQKRLVLKQREYNRKVYAAKAASRGSQKPVRRKVRRVLLFDEGDTRSRNNSPISGPAGLPAGEHGNPLPGVPPEDARPVGQSD